MSTSIEKNMRTTTEALLHEFEGQWQPGATIHLRAPGCEHVILPSSLNIPKRSNDEYAAYFEKIAPLVSDATMTMDDYVAAPADRKVVCRSTLHSTTQWGHYTNEYIWWLTFDDKGEKIVQITEFFDGMLARELLSKIKGAGVLD